MGVIIVWKGKIISHILFNFNALNNSNSQHNRYKRLNFNLGRLEGW